MRSLLLAAALSLLASPLLAQSLVGDVGIYIDRFTTEPTAEVALYTPDLGRGVTAYAQLSFLPLAEVDPELPTVITHLSVPVLLRGPWAAAVEGGLSWMPSDQYRPEPTLDAVVAWETGLGQSFLFAFLGTRPRADWDLGLTLGVGTVLAQLR